MIRMFRTICMLLTAMGLLAFLNVASASANDTDKTVADVATQQCSASVSWRNVGGYVTSLTCSDWDSTLCSYCKSVQSRTVRTHIDLVATTAHMKLAQTKDESIGSKEQHLGSDLRSSEVQLGNPGVFIANGGASLCDGRRQTRAEQDLKTTTDSLNLATELEAFRRTQKPEA